MGRGLIIILIASLALNVFAFGFFSGRVISKDGPPARQVLEQRARMDNPFALMHYASELPPGIRDDFRGKIRGKLPVLRERHQKTQKLRGELALLIAAEDWDRAAVTEKFEEIKTEQDRQREVFNAAFIDAVETLPAAERKKLIETASKRRMGRRFPRDRRMPPGEEEQD